ncbi:MAG: hypothetical protein K0R51_1095 [Cytophagaceae bacterium]|jgi:CHASE2 domain-containing sensor protein|nr:hypothetical protein [Cytophagaceae bacterium]
MIKQIFILFGILFGHLMKVNAQNSPLIKIDFQDSNIAIVNAGHLDRGGMAKMVTMISGYDPKVIAVNFRYSKSRVTSYDDSLRSAFSKVKNLVLASTEDYKVVANAEYGKQALLITEDNRLIGFVYDTTSFEYKIIKLYSPDKLESFARYKNDTIPVNRLCGGMACFSMASYEAVFEELVPPEAFKNKIVLIGYVSDKNKLYKSREYGDVYIISDTEDALFTNINRTNFKFPDMHGTQILASELSMILAEEYIYTINDSEK